MSYHVDYTIQKKTENLGRKAIEFDYYKNSESLGVLKVSKTKIIWEPSGRWDGRSLSVTWAKFNSIMRKHAGKTIMNTPKYKFEYKRIDTERDVTFIIRSERKLKQNEIDSLISPHMHMKHKRGSTVEIPTIFGASTGL